MRDKLGNFIYNDSEADTKNYNKVEVREMIILEN